MASLISLVIPIAIVLSPAPTASKPIIEDWTAASNSYDVHQPTAGRFLLAGIDPVLQKSTARFTVQSGDTYRGSTGERSEVVLGGWESTSRFRVVGNEGIEFYRISVKLSPDWTAPNTNLKGHAWGVFFQSHGPNEYGAPPAIALHAENKFSLYVLGGDLNAKVGGRRFMTKSDLNVGRWIDFVLEINWAPDSSGSIAVYRRDEGEHNWEKVSDIKSVATLQYKGNLIPNSHYWKAGFYRSESRHTNTLWLGPIQRGRTFDEVTK